ncbi:DUF6701 domain-containing protein [Pseudomonas sp.]|uniref:DUF6701 domain-containing protein n=1 Tax=Pseudomonas sp. TaxID=306 RepID=UPI0019E3CAE0|nr:DUF6701 domain-containing protein [Pseudomonas sp.]MBF0674037.1 hypothetical protein [Pseudomonas sp.]
MSRSGLLQVLLGVLLLLHGPAGLAAALCSSVWSPGEQNQGLNVVPRSELALPTFKGGPVLTANDLQKVDVGMSYWEGGMASNNWSLEISLPAKGTAQVFVKGDLRLGNNARLNEAGTPDMLVLIVDGDLIIESNNVVIRGFVYATGSIEFKNNATLRGGLSANDQVVGKNNTDAEFDGVALARTDFAGICQQGLAGVNHFQLLFSTPLFSCEAIPVRVRACADATCTTTVSINQTLTLTPASRWLGDGTVTFAGTDTVTAYLKRQPGTVELGVAGEPFHCNNGNCALETLESGFEFRVPELVAGQAADVQLQALRLDKNSGACVADGSFAGSERALAFWSGYSAPASGSRAVHIGGDAIGIHPGAASLKTLRFDAQARSRFPIRYDDAGVMELHARYQGSGEEEGLDMRGSASFISRPYGFCIDAGTPITGCSGASCPLFEPKGQVVRAGDPFDLHITPVGIAASQFPADLCAAQPTPNFTGTLVLSAPIEEPIGGAEGALEYKKYQHPLGGIHELKDQKLHEVGSFRIEVRSEGYLGLAPLGSASDVVGRFASAYLRGQVNLPILQPGCGVGATGFSYQGQDIDYAVAPELTITGMSRNNTPTANYDRGDFWKLADTLEPVVGFLPEQPQDASRFSTGRFELQDDTVAGNGSKTYRLNGAARYERHSGGPQPVVDAPFEPSLVLIVRGEQLIDKDGTCQGATCESVEFGPFGFQFPGSEIRLGRLRIGNAHGSELHELPLPVTAEYFDGQRYRLNERDNCTRIDPAIADAFVPTDSGAGGPVLSYLEANKVGGEYWLEKGTGAYLLSAPGVSGSQNIRFETLGGWLKHDWDGDGQADYPKGLATFGIYKGHDKMIFRREVIGR